MKFLLGVSDKKFEFEKPGNLFAPLEDGTGYYDSSIKSTIKYLLTPWQYEQALNEYRKSYVSKEGTKLIDSFIMKSGFDNKEYFILIERETPPPEVKSESCILFSAITTLGNNFTINIIGVYPESKDKELRVKFIKSAMTIKEKY